MIEQIRRELCRLSNLIDECKGKINNINSKKHKRLIEIIETGYSVALMKRQYSEAIEKHLVEITPVLKELDFLNFKMRVYKYAIKEVKSMRVKLKRLRHKKRIKEYIDDVKKEPCTDCKLVKSIEEMTFDHLGDKKFNIADYAKKTLRAVKLELEKCEVVCKPCHVVREFKRGRMYQKQGLPESLIKK